jgi:quercetin dioxygenase-like cupin family protein
MKVTELQDAERVPIQIDARKLFIRQDLELIHLNFGPGETLEKHANPFDVIFYVLEGSGELVIEEEKKQVGKDSTVEVSANLLRSWKNNRDSNLRILVIKILNK